MQDDERQMIDRAARTRLAESLRALAAGVISNDQFEDRQTPSQDPGVAEIQMAAWHLYSDTHEHRLTGGYKLSKQARREVARCVLFLRSDQEYRCPRASGWKLVLFILLNVATFGLFWRAFGRMLFGDAAPDGLWPFRTPRDQNAAIRQRGYLQAGRRAG